MGLRPANFVPSIGAAARIIPRAIPGPVGLALNAATVGSMIYDYF
jgi:hypothetical protein